MKRKIIKEGKIMEENNNAIDKFDGDYAFLSNFYPCIIVYDGITYQSSEAAFQAQKCIDKSDRYKFCTMEPGAAKRYGKRVDLRTGWDQIKDGIMEEIVDAKFNQNPDLKQKLKDTAGRLLIEGNNWRDYYWGVCGGKGQNHLGIILMTLRDKYLAE